MGGIESKEVTRLKDIQPGDHIKYRRHVVLYAHHAIVVEVNVAARTYTIIHFDGNKTNGSANIQQTTKMFGNETFHVLEYPSNARFTKQETVAIAKYFLRNGFGSYNLLINNCEHFSTTCATGYPCSIQTVRAAFAAHMFWGGIPAIMAYCQTKKVIDVKKVNGRFVITLLN